MTQGAWRQDPAWPVLEEQTLAATGAGPAPGTYRVLAVLGLTLAVLGVPLGLLWAGVSPDVPLRVVEGAGGGLAFVDAQPEQPAAADGWFTLLAAPFGVLAAVVWWRFRHVRGPVPLVVLVAAAALAGMVAWLVGRQVGLAGYEAALAGASPGDLLQRPPDLRVVEAGWWPPRVLGAPLVPALTAAVTYTLLAAWSRYATLHPDHD